MDPQGTPCVFWGNSTVTSPTRDTRESIRQLIFIVEGLMSNLLGLPVIIALDLVARLDAATDSLTDLGVRGQTQA